MYKITVKQWCTVEGCAEEKNPYVLYSPPENRTYVCSVEAWLRQVCENNWGSFVSTVLLCFLTSHFKETMIKANKNLVLNPAQS